MKKTKIVCTLGPATDQIQTIETLLKNGMNVARFNFSHGNQENHKKHIAMTRAASVNTGIPVGIMLDTKGPEMRLGTFKTDKVFLEEGQTFILTGRQIEGDETIVSVNHQVLAKEIKPGNQILLADGLIRLSVQSITDLDITTIVQNSGQMSNNKRVAVPGAHLSLPFLSEKDISDISLGIAEEIDFIAASFVQCADDILAMRAVLDAHQAPIQIIAKIENAEGVNNLGKILTVADGVMVARGDLGVEIPAEEVPLIQKKIIKLCNQVGKPVITATQMLESMTVNPRPTRAEASDVANAILDGSDAIMLSAETASGNYPVEAVKTMTSIAQYTESALDSEKSLTRFGYSQTNTTNAICHATVQISHELNAKGIITATESGFTARMVSRYRPKAAILAVTPHLKTIRRLQLVWGIIPIQGAPQKNTDAMTKEAIQRAIEERFIQKGDLVVVTAGVPVGLTGSTNMIQVHIAGEENLL